VIVNNSLEAPNAAHKKLNYCPNHGPRVVENWTQCILNEANLPPPGKKTLIRLSTTTENDQTHALYLEFSQVTKQGTMPRCQPRHSLL